MQRLIVVRSFGPWKVGDVVIDEGEIAEVLASEHLSHVVRIDPVEEN